MNDNELVFLLCFLTYRLWAGGGAAVRPRRTMFPSNDYQTIAVYEKLIIEVCLSVCPLSIIYRAQLKININ